MDEKMAEKERFELSTQLLTVQVLIEIRDLLKEIRGHLGAQPFQAEKQLHGYSLPPDELDEVQTMDLPLTLKEMRLPGLQAALSAVLLDALPQEPDEG
ncbi:hypothetical protein [Deinococcus arenicola]|uniref:Uncharacterized protein n=1 Tax=Deinococcus arenicola TaxID=2994950 RepID=A0ABU4DVJ1_9DEIO|nr:hypothetical protein [Deinococcus sp. ZS9-10]MDV6376455.1 hypothetical protein [Deinococcus sp. ZS9-10]